MLLNDHNPYIVLRNLLLLLILGKYADQHSVVDVALHFWYSTFVPVHYELPVQDAIIRFTKQLGTGGKFSCHVSSTSRMTGLIDSAVLELLRATQGASYGPGDAANEINRVR